MKTKSTLLVIMLFPFILSGKALALFVAIDHYPPKSGWLSIHATNDYAIVLPMLQDAGYLNKNIRTLLNDQATKKAIMTELRDINRQSKKGDDVYIHFSCHGQQMIDDNGDEQDGLDEALVPYDAKKFYEKGIYEGENHIRDDELNKILTELQLTLGASGNITVVLDACHSGSATRYGDDDAYIRGTNYVFTPYNQPTNALNTPHTYMQIKGEKHLSTISIFSACKAHEVNYEYYDPESKQYYGSLSYAFCKLAKPAFKQNVLNKTFFENLEHEINSLFKNKNWTQSPYFESNAPLKIFKITQ